jgi:hypothetical protein
VKGDDLLLWVLVALLLAAMALTVLIAPGRKSRHGYGGLTPPAGPEEKVAGGERQGGGPLLRAALLDRAVTPRL